MNRAINKIKVAVALLLIVVGLSYEINLWIALREDDAIDDLYVYVSSSKAHVPLLNIHHILFGLSMLSGAIILASIKPDRPNVSGKPSV